MVEQTLEDYARQITNAVAFASIITLLLYPVARGYLTLSDLEIANRYQLGGFIALAGMIGIMLRSGNEILTELVYNTYLRRWLWFLTIPGIIAFGNAAEYASLDSSPIYKFVMLLIFLFLTLLCATAAQALVIGFLTDSDDDKIETSAYSGGNSIEDTAKALIGETRSSTDLRIRSRLMQDFRTDCESILRKMHSDDGAIFLTRPRILRNIHDTVWKHAFNNLVSKKKALSVEHQDAYVDFLKQQGAYNIVLQNMMEILIDSLRTNYEKGYIYPRDVYQLALFIEMMNYKSMGKHDLPGEMDFLSNNKNQLSRFYSRSEFLNYHFSNIGQENEYVSKQPAPLRVIFSASLLISFVEYLTKDYSAGLVENLDIQVLSTLTETFSQSFDGLPTFHYPQYVSNTGEAIQLKEGDAGKDDPRMKSCEGLKSALNEFVTAYMDNKILSNREMFRPGNTKVELNEKLQIEVRKYLAELGD